MHSLLRGKKLLVLLVLLPLAVYGGIKFYVHRTVKNGLEQLTQAAAPFVSIRYGKIDSSLTGSITVRDVQFQPTGLTDIIPVDEIEIRLSGPGALLTARNRIEAGENPEVERVTLRGLSLDLRSSMMSSLDALIGTMVDSGNFPREQHCGDIRYFGPRAYRRLGYESLVMDIAVSEQREPFLNRLTLNIDWRTRDMAQLETSVVLTGIPGNLKKAKAGELDPQVASFKAVYRDLSYTERVKKLCAEAGGISVEEYVRLITEDDAALAASWGAIPGPGLRDAYRRFIEKPGEVRVEAKPADGLDPRNLALYKPQDLISMLNLNLQVNGEPVTDLSIRSASNAPAGAAPEPGQQAGVDAPTAGSPDAVTPPAAPAVAQPQKPPQPGYREVSFDELPQHIGRKLRLHAPDRVHEGILVELDQKSVTIARQYRGSGSMTYKVPRNGIRKAEALF